MLNAFPNLSPNPSSPRYLLVGNYGVGNAGDEILREYFLKRFPDIRWKVLSAHPGEGEYARIPAGVRSLFSLRWLETLRELRASKGMVFGGGSLFTDTESVRACFIWFLHAAAAWMLRKPIFLTFQGIGPFRTKVGEWCARWVVEKAAFISVRDDSSGKRLKEWKKSTEVVQSFDPSLSLLEAPKGINRIKNLFIFIPKVSTCESAVDNLMIPLFVKLKEKGVQLQILSLQPENACEHSLCETYGKICGGQVIPVYRLTEASMLLAEGAALLTQRYHGALAALAAGIPFLALRERGGDKLDTLATVCHCPSVDISSLTSDILTKTDWENIASGLPTIRSRFLELVRQGEDALREAVRSLRVSPERERRAHREILDSSP